MNSPTLVCREEVLWTGEAGIVSTRSSASFDLVRFGKPRQLSETEEKDQTRLTLRKRETAIPCMSLKTITMKSHSESFGVVELSQMKSMIASGRSRTFEKQFENEWIASHAHFRQIMRFRNDLEKFIRVKHRIRMGGSSRMAKKIEKRTYQ
jgi:hypothetical protein